MKKTFVNKAHCGAEGFTLIELLVVVAIIGILSSMGVVGLQGAIENNRVKDAALNTAAFLERVANDANRRSATLCLKKAGSQKIEVYLGDDCTNPEGDPVDEFSLEGPLTFVSDGCDIENEFDGTVDGTGSNWLSAAGNVGVFKPKLGLSAAPASGYISVQYGNEAHCAAAFKSKSKNSIIPMVGDDEGWDEL